VISRQQLLEHLVASRIAGQVQTTRENNLANFRLLADRDEAYLFGLELEGRWSYEDVLACMAERCGVDPDPSYTGGEDTIDPERTIDRLDAMGERLARAARDRERVVVATGHPSGVLEIHLAIAAALRAAGCSILMPAVGWSYSEGNRWRRIRYMGGVAVVSNGGSLNHTHSAAPMRAILAEETPDFVVGDHGWTGAAGQAGVDAVGFADCNDPALFVGEAEGKVAVSVPLDDNVQPHLYAPVSAYLLDRL
jgi:hypothetical protein